jgi:hypothetical protein
VGTGSGVSLSAIFRSINYDLSVGRLTVGLLPYYGPYLPEDLSRLSISNLPLKSYFVTSQYESIIHANFMV